MRTPPEIATSDELPEVLRKGLLSIGQLSEYLGVPVNTIYDWNRRGTGPRRIKVGQAVRWRMSDVDAWLEDRSA